MPRAMTSADAFNAVAERRRRDILEYLAADERAVSDIVTAMGIGQPSISKHLRVLRDVGLVDSRRDGRRILYRANLEGIRPIHEWAGQFERHWQRHLQQIRDRAESNPLPGA